MHSARDVDAFKLATYSTRLTNHVAPYSANLTIYYY
jgi:hypothetical protein